MVKRQPGGKEGNLGGGYKLKVGGGEKKGKIFEEGGIADEKQDIENRGNWVLKSENA